MLSFFYAVFGLDRGDSLNVRRGPDARTPIIARLPDGYGNLQIMGKPVLNDTTEWVLIRFGGRSGWVNKAYLQVMP